MPHVAADELRTLAAALFAASGTPADLAAIVSDSLVSANLVGHDSHGVLRIPGYISAARQGDVQVAARARVQQIDRGTGRVDGALGWGQPAMWLATETVRERADEHGVGCVAVHNCFHIGRVAPYVEYLAQHGKVGIAMANAGPAVAPFGGRTRLFGTNPLAWAVPRAGREPLSFDIATAAIAEGKLRVAQSKALPVAPGLLVTEEGLPTISPDDFYAGGSILPFGGHKGNGISLLAQVLGIGLAGVDHANFTGPRGVNGPIIIAIDIPPFMNLDDFGAAITTLGDRINASPPAEGVERVLLPGDIENQTREEREATGVPIPDSTWDSLRELATELEVRLPAV